MKELIERAQNAALSIISIIHLPTAANAGCLEDDIRDMFAYAGEEDFEHLAQHLPLLAGLADAEDDEELEGALMYYLGNPDAEGFIVEASVPSTRRVANGIVSVSHGVSTRSLWYGRTYEEALERAVAWAEPLYGNNFR